MVYNSPPELQKSAKRIYSTKKLRPFTVPGTLLLCLEDNFTGFYIYRIEYISQPGSSHILSPHL